jgi:outer membrane immunogenic protein
MHAFMDRGVVSDRFGFQMRPRLRHVHQGAGIGRTGHIMKKYVLAAAAFGAFIAPAVGADMPIKALAPPPTPWTGWYVGLNAGYASSGANVTTASRNTYAYPVDGGPELASAITGLSNFSSPANDNGFMGGAQIGGNWQLEKIWVAGIEADIQGGTSSQGSHTIGSTLVLPNGFPNSVVQTASVSRKLDYLGTARGRFGVLVGSLLFYGTAGLAYGGVSASTSITQTLLGGGLNATWAGAGAYSGTLIGWTGGAGAEWMFSPNWSTKVEYLHYDLGAGTYGMTPLVTNAPATKPFTVNVLESNARFNGDVIRAGLNYHF